MIDYDVAATFKLSPRMCEVLVTLLTFTVLPSRDVDAILIHRLRKELSGYNISIKTKKGLGYWIPEPDKLRIKRALKPLKTKSKPRK